MKGAEINPAVTPNPILNPLLASELDIIISNR